MIAKCEGVHVGKTFVGNLGDYDGAVLQQGSGVLFETAGLLMVTM